MLSTPPKALREAGRFLGCACRERPTSETLNWPCCARPWAGSRCAYGTTSVTCPHRGRRLRDGGCACPCGSANGGRRGGDTTTVAGRKPAAVCTDLPDLRDQFKPLI